jgi:hypothetical protein
MAPVEAGSARNLLEAAVVGFSVLGGSMAYLSGFYASQALALRQSPEVVAQRVNEGLAVGFRAGSPASIVAFIMMVWS